MPVASRHVVLYMASNRTKCRGSHAIAERFLKVTSAEQHSPRLTAFASVIREMMYHFTVVATNEKTLEVICCIAIG